MKQAKLGGVTCSQLGYGCMSLSPVIYKVDDANFSDEDALKVLRRARELGVTHFDSAFVYGLGHNETLLGKWIAEMGREEREKLLIASKTGIKMSATEHSICGDKDYILSEGRKSAERLGSYIDILYLHRIDTSVPIEQSMEAMKELIAEGVIKGVGLSEASANTIRRAHAVQPITAVQIEYSLWSRDVEEEVIPTCRELGIGVVAYSPLGRGFLTGAFKTRDDLKEGDWRLNNPRFEQDAMEQNAKLVEKIEKMAAEKGEGCTASKLALAWVMAQGDDIVPIPGTSKVANLEKNVDAMNFLLTAEEAKALSDIMQPDYIVGSRYEAGHYTHDQN